MAIETTTELRTYVEEEIGDIAASTTTQGYIVDLLDRAHKVICSGGGELNLDDKGKAVRRPVIFPWARSQTPSVQNFEAPIETGTVSVTQSSTTATLSSAPAASVADWHLQVDDDTEVYRVASHTGGSPTATLDGGYVEDTNAAANYKLFRLIYTFSESSSILLPASMIKLYDGNGNRYMVPLTDMNELYEKYPLPVVSQAVPNMAGVLKQGDGTLVVQFNAYPDDIKRMELDYVPVPSSLVAGSVDPIVPKHHRLVIAHLALYYKLRRRDDDRANSHLGTAKGLFDSLVTEAKQIYHGNDDEFGYIAPRPGQGKAMGFRRIGPPIGY